MYERYRRIASLARLVVVDGLRSHAVIGLLCLAAVCEVGGLLFFEFIPKDIGRVSSDFILSIGFVTGLFYLFFYAINVTAWGGDKRLIYTLLARPLSRCEYILGLCSGLLLLLLVLNGILSVTGFIVLHLIQAQVDPVYFLYLSPAAYFFSWLGIVAIECALLSVIALFSGLVRGNFIVFLLSISYYLICNGLPVVRNVVATGGKEQPLLGILTGMTAVFPDFSQLDFKRYIISPQILPLVPEGVTSVLLILFYCLVILWLACFVYSRKDLR